MHGTSEFTESAQLAEIVRFFAQERALSKATIVHYSSSLAKFIDYLILHRFPEFPNVKEVREIRTPYQKNFPETEEASAKRKNFRRYQLSERCKNSRTKIVRSWKKTWNRHI